MRTPAADISRSVWQGIIKKIVAETADTKAGPWPFALAR